LVNGQWTFVAALATGVPADGQTGIAFTSPDDGWASGYVSKVPAA
jgi:hypothetical protein